MILVTGATGMTGARLCFDLLQRGEKVRALKRNGSSTHLLENYLLREGTSSQNLEWVNGDLLEPDTLEQALDGVHTVFHTGAFISFRPGDEERMLKVNSEGTANLVNLCLEKPDFRYFAHVSSVATLGRGPGEQLLDENSQWDPALHPSAYAISKYSAEREVWRGIAEGLPAVMVNPSIILGPGNWQDGSPALFRKVKEGFPFFTRGVSGFTDVRDVSDALLFLWEHKITGERYILNGHTLSFGDLFKEIARALQTRPPYFEVKAWMTNVAWPIDRLRCMITGKKPFITRETARSARSRHYYSSAKIESLGFRFRPLAETIRFTASYLP
jgi:nucleoside-diphosphate-sugar epimerase